MKRAPAQVVLRVVLAITLAAALSTSACGRIKRAAYAPDDRDDWQMPERVIESLELAPGSRVADIGAGGGYFTFRLSDAVGAGGVVYAVDVDTEMLAYIAERAAREGRANIRTREARPGDPDLPDAAIDLVFTSNTYHHLPDRIDYFERLRIDLAPGGRVAIVEFVETGWLSRWFGHNTEPELIRDEMQAAGYDVVADHDFLPRQTFTIFAPRARD